MAAQVVVAGGGPVGKLVALMLAREGVECLLVGRPRAGRHPKAHALTCRSMEVFRQLGIEGAVAARDPGVEQWGRFSYSSTLTGGCFGVQAHTDTEAYANLCRNSLSRPAHVSQPYVEDAIDEALYEEAAASGSPLRLLLEHHCEADPAHAGAGSRRVSATAVEGSSSSGGVVSVEAEHLVICDGANSSLRRAFGGRMEGPGYLQSFMSVHFTSRQLGATLLARAAASGAPPPSMLHFVFNSSVICCVVAHNLDDGEFVMQAPYYPKYESPERDFTPEKCASLVRAAVGSAAVDDVVVHAAHPWLMAAQVADTFNPAPGVFLAGDSGHRFPPSGGLGLNTGIGDAHNLAWKLAAYHRHGAGAPLLATYDAERRPVVGQMLDTAVECFQRGMKVPNHLGLYSETVDQLGGACAALSSFVPAAATESLFQAGMFAGRHMTYTTSLKKAAVQKTLDKEGIPLFFSNDDLGYTYRPETSTALAAAEGCGASAAPALEKSSNGLDIYVPSLRVGGRMPAAPYAGAFPPLDSGAEAEESGKQAVYEMPRSVSEWSLLLLRRGSGTSGDFKLDAQGFAAAFAGAVPVRVYDCDVDAASCAEQWGPLLAAHDCCAVLVRPDGHVAWTSSAAEVVTPDVVDSVIRKVLSM